MGLEWQRLIRPLINTTKQDKMPAAILEGSAPKASRKDPLDG